MFQCHSNLLARDRVEDVGLRFDRLDLNRCLGSWRDGFDQGVQVARFEPKAGRIARGVRTRSETVKPPLADRSPTSRWSSSKARSRTSRLAAASSASYEARALGSPRRVRRISGNLVQIRLISVLGLRISSARRPGRLTTRQSLLQRSPIGSGLHSEYRVEIDYHIPSSPVESNAISQPIVAGRADRV